MSDNAPGDLTILNYRTDDRADRAHASPAAFAKSVANFRYDVQQAHYCEGFNVDRFVFVAIEKEPPYLVGVYVLDDIAELRGQRLRERDIQLYLDCAENDFWPGYSATIAELSLPNWSL